MNKLIILCILSFAFAWLLCYAAMRTAEKIVHRTEIAQQQIELVAP